MRSGKRLSNKEPETEDVVSKLKTLYMLIIISIIRMIALNLDLIIVLPPRYQIRARHVLHHGLSAAADDSSRSLQDFLQSDPPLRVLLQHNQLQKELLGKHEQSLFRYHEEIQPQDV